MANQQYPTATAYNPELYPNQQYQQQPNQQYQYAPVAQGAGQKRGDQKGIFDLVIPRNLLCSLSAMLWVGLRHIQYQGVTLPPWY